MDASSILVRIRAVLGITRADLARLAQLSPSTVGRIEKGTLDPTWKTLTRVLETTGFHLHGESIRPICDPTAAAAARIALDRVLHTADAEPSAPVVPERTQIWLDRWERTGWFTTEIRSPELSTMARAAAIISNHARRDTPQLAIGDGRRWRELALRIDESGMDYAVSDLATAHELPATSLCVQPKIYVRDAPAVAALLREDVTTPGYGVLMIGTEGPELDGAADGYALRFTSIGQAIMDALAGTDHESRRAQAVLAWLLAATR